MASAIKVKQKEAKTISFIISGTFSLSGAEFIFAVKKRKSDITYIIKKEDADFNKTEIASRKVKIKLSVDDLNQAATIYVSELGIIFSGDNIDKSSDIRFEIEAAVIH